MSKYISQERRVRYAADAEGLRVIVETVAVIDYQSLGNHRPTNLGTAVAPDDPDAVPVEELRARALELAGEMADRHGVPRDAITEDQGLLHEDR